MTKAYSTRFVNKYSFHRVSDAVLKELGSAIGEGVNVTLHVKDDALIVKKRNASFLFFFKRM